MKISEWLDMMEAECADVSSITPPNEMTYDEIPDEAVYFKEARPCSILCTGNHPYSTVERFGHWYYCRGQDRKAKLHSDEMRWSFFTRDRDLAIRTAKAHIMTE